jgi:ligand-binding SRPBCC domain-containing protein
MPVLDHAFTVRAPLSAVAEFHRKMSVLKTLTPPPLIIQLHKVEPLAENSISEFTMWFGPLPVKWTALHFNVHPLNGFTDIQTSGPLKSWKHVHHFTAEGERLTRVNDHIEYEHHDGLRGLFTRLAFPLFGLRLVWAHRAFVTRRALEVC